MIFLEYAKCSTCQKAKKWLDLYGIDYIDRPIREQNPTLDELTAWIRASGLPCRKFFNTSGLKYKELHIKEKLETLSDEEKIQLLASDGMLVKRPLLIDGETVLVGFRPQEWESLLKA